MQETRVSAVVRASNTAPFRYDIIFDEQLDLGSGDTLVYDLPADLVAGEYRDIDVLVRRVSK